MDRLARILRWLALFAGVVGVACFYQVYRPADVAGWLAAAGHLLSEAAALPAVWTAATTTVAAAAGAWMCRRALAAPVFETRQRSVHQLEIDVPELRSTDDAAGGPEPVIGAAGSAARRRRDRWRVRLEAHLEGAGDVVAFVDDLFGCALRAGASDVHLQPLERLTRVSFRAGGQLEEVAAVPRVHHAAIVRRLKVLARLVPYQTDRPQDGHIVLDTPLGAVDLRLSTLPTQHGEKAVLRLARSADGRLSLDRLGLPAPVRAAFGELLAEPQGLLVLTGPTGSGKTTTLYGALAHIHRTRGETVNIATLEDPIEVDLPFLNQTERAPGLDFHKALRAVLRQDPNVLMIGEVRDRETCQTAVQAGLSGHLILTTLHADSAAGVFNRLVDLGAEPFLVASSVLATVSQRLVRRLCPQCRRPEPVSDDFVRRLAARGVDVAGRTFQTAGGCAACERTGFQGRKAIFELLRVSPALRRAITAKAATDQIRELAIEEGMTPLLTAVMAEVEAGVVSLEEALKVVE